MRWQLKRMWRFGLPLHRRIFRGADVVILPGSKNTLEDLDYLVTAGFPAAVDSHVQRGGELIGICAGYQMLGQSISDPKGLERGGTSRGLGFLDVRTELDAPKICRQVRARSLLHGVEPYALTPWI